MSNKLQELTDRLYSEGLSKGKEQGELLVSEARSEAENIIAQAKAQAEQKAAEEAETSYTKDLPKELSIAEKKSERAEEYTQIQDIILG